jgi:ribonuclease P protein component
LLREAVRARQDALAQGWDLVFVARSPLAGATLSQAQAAVNQLLKRANVVNL